MSQTRTRSARFSFWFKAAAAAALIALADFLIFDRGGYAPMGLFALAWIAAVALVQPAVLRNRGGLVALGAAIVFALLLIEHPGLLVWTLFWVSLSLALLLPRMAGFDNALRWAIRLLLHWLSSAIAPLHDALKLRAMRRKRRRGRRPIGAIAGLVGLPLLGGTAFLILFASANPLIDQAFGSVRLPEIHILRLFFWGFVLLALWPSFRPRRVATTSFNALPELDADLPGVNLASVRLSLILFNLIFAMQNGLDLAFLWSGAPLPEGVTLADYAHRGAYPLIATALLAGFFVLVTMRPGSQTAASPLVRRLVLVWIAQNLLLVASSILRTIDYIEGYSLTQLRIAALAWMALVAVGLVLICWRLFRGRSASWLINVNAAAAALVLTAATVIDIGAVAAAWNVRHAQEVGGRGAALDLCYLRQLGPSALVSLAELERRPIPSPLRDRVHYIRMELQTQLTNKQNDWRGWTWRGARRLAAAEAAVGQFPVRLSPSPQGRDCDGTILPPPPVQPIIETTAPAPAPPPPPAPALTAKPAQ